VHTSRPLLESGGEPAVDAPAAGFQFLRGDCHWYEVVTGLFYPTAIFLRDSAYALADVFGG
jgi:hypothetical protein